MPRLLEILDDLYYEYAIGYVHYLNIINNMKESQEFNPQKIDIMRQQVSAFTQDKDDLVCKKHGINSIFLEEWIRR